MSSTGRLLTRLNVSAENLRKSQETNSESLPSPREYSFISLRNTHDTDPHTEPSAFDYKTIANNFIYDDQYRGGVKNKGYLTFILREVDTPPEDKPFHEYGLKIHISLNDTIEGNIEKGWNAIVDILRQYHVAKVKVADTAIIKRDETISPIARGKQITIYACVHPENSDWENVLQAIVTALEKNQIVPGDRPPKEHSISMPNNPYLSYRFDRDLDSTSEHPYRAANSQGALPEGMRDPFSNLNVASKKMTPPVKYENDSTRNFRP